MDLELILASTGATVILTLSKLFRWLQNLHDVFKCCLCCGFWIGGTLHWLKHEIGLKAFLCGLIVALTSYTWFLLMKYFLDRYD